ncbi:hypothetical protein KIN20_009586 [Parelaphostrongylus tenuis]|uniref:Uncharacterized protein n=1 Tax=Parelaphostrongylus tenuis TaxID=148309 RepID=A0AAD5MRZ8_PARTN|nr:hypothetical protein KIN20_009586 [Parelaphostrongylus tenuis]
MDKKWSTRFAYIHKLRCKNLNKQWVNTASATGLETSVISLKNNDPIRPALYLLIKTHKLTSIDVLVSTDPSTYKVRPITSGIGGTTDRIT